MIHTLRRKLSASELNEVLENLLQQAMMMHKTKAGTLQLLNKEDNVLEIVASSGLSPEFSEHFKIVRIDDGSVCARALKSGETIFIEDLTLDKLFAPHLDLALQNNITSVLSTPMISSNGNIVGMISTHFRIPRKPSQSELDKFENFCHEAADKIEALIAD